MNQLLRLAIRGGIDRVSHVAGGVAGGSPSWLVGAKCGFGGKPSGKIEEKINGRAMFIYYMRTDIRGSQNNSSLITTSPSKETNGGSKLEGRNVVLRLCEL